MWCGQTKTKQHETTLLQSDEMFDGIDEAKFFSKNEFNRLFNHIHMNPEDISKKRSEYKILSI